MSDESKKPTPAKKPAAVEVDPLEHLPQEQREAFKKFLELQKKGTDIDRLIAVAEKEEKEEAVINIKKELAKNQDVTLRGFIDDLQSNQIPYFNELTLKEISEAVLSEYIAYLKTQATFSAKTKNTEDKEKRTRSANLTESEIAEGRKAVLEVLSSNVVTNGRKGGLNKTEIAEKLPNIKEQQIIRGIKDLKEEKIIVIEGLLRKAKYYIV